MERERRIRRIRTRQLPRGVVRVTIEVSSWDYNDPDYSEFRKLAELTFEGPRKMAIKDLPAVAKNLLAEEGFSWEDCLILFPKPLSSEWSSIGWIYEFEMWKGPWVIE